MIDVFLSVFGYPFPTRIKMTPLMQKLSDELKSVLASITEEEVVKLITGRQVDLAEELKYIRKIHGLLKELHELLQRVGA
jgi:hypothetical protein